MGMPARMLLISLFIVQAKSQGCSPIPADGLFCRLTFEYTDFSSAASSQLRATLEQVTLLSSNANIEQDCADFFAYYQCIGSYTPCDAASMKIYTFCEDTCSAINNYALRCLNFTKVDPASLQYLLGFNCSNPLTYTSSLTLNYYVPPNDGICSAVHSYLLVEESPDTDHETSEGLTVGQIAGIIIGGLSVVAVASIIIIILLKKNMSSIKERHIILRKDDIFTTNPQYNLTLKTTTNHVSNENGVESTIKFDASASSAEVIGSSIKIIGSSNEVDYVNVIDVEKLIGSYQEQLAPLLVKRSEFVMDEEIGQGAFGKVFKGVIYLPDNTDPVAIKTIKTSEWSSEDMKSFLLECCKMSELHHPNVLGLLGICFEDSAPYMLLQYMANGDLKGFLLSKRVTEEDVTVYPEDLNENIILEMILDIAKGMEYLATCHFIHRDLAARNCMVDDNLLVKIADFGLSRDVYESNYYVLRHSAKLPVRWMALESILDGRFNLTTDVWSYGVTCWEIFSLGRQPYPGISHGEISEYLSSGNRLARPYLCPASLYTLITTCWELKSDDRPTFTDLVTKIDRFKQLKANTEQMDSVNDSTTT